MIPVAFVLMYVWPVIYDGLVHFGESIQGMGSVGAGIYAFFNRMLIPVGLHHALNSVFWFDVAGINDIPNFLGGAQSIAAGTAEKGITGMYQAGFFPVMMFGLPGAALAIYQTAKKQNKEKVASIMIAAAFASFFTGVTEPLEFAFMFVAPALYVLHAVLTGLSVFIAASMQWIAGFGFSAGLVDLVLSSRNPLATDWFMLIPQGIVFFTLYYTLFRVAITKFNLKTPGREEDPAVEATNTNTVSAPVGAPVPAAASVGAPSSDRSELARQYLQVLGGRSNLETIDACITRLRLTMKDASIVDDNQLKALGAAGVIRLGEKNIQVILGPMAEIIAGEMKTVSEAPVQAAAPAPTTPSNDRAELARQYMDVLGGRDNLENIDACITRLRLTLKDSSIVDDSRLKALGAAGVIRLGERNMQVILGPLAEIIAGKMRAIS
jgi:PTS system N-acetylglucosamine-specific IIC component